MAIIRHLLELYKLPLVQSAIRIANPILNGGVIFKREIGLVHLKQIFKKTSLQLIYPQINKSGNQNLVRLSL
jgi:hypothetical protein